MDKTIIKGKWLGSKLTNWSWYSCMCSKPSWDNKLIHIQSAAGSVIFTSYEAVLGFRERFTCKESIIDLENLHNHDPNENNQRFYKVTCL